MLPRSCYFSALVALTLWAFSSFAASGIDYSSAWDCDQSKFYWYCEKTFEEEMQPDSLEKTLQEEALTQLEALQQELKEQRALAIMHPTAENVIAYIDLQNRMMEQASLFSDVWRRVVWQTPEINYENKYPVNNSALTIHKEEVKVAQINTLQEISEDWGIFFFMRSDCPYCHIMAQTLTSLSAQYGLTVIPITLDGGGLPQYPKPRMDNGLATQLGVSEVPYMVLGNVREQQLIPIGSGVISGQDLISRIHILTTTQPGESY